MSANWLPLFVKESNWIEGIKRKPTPEELAAHETILALDDRPDVADIQAFVRAVQPDAILRSKAGLNVRVGRHVAPAGGPDIPLRLEGILERAVCGDPYRIHHEYETLHPFTDGNGRSGRALWMWMMERGTETQRRQLMELGFLHTWYYQSLEAGR